MSDEEEVEDASEETEKKPSAIKTLLFSGISAIALGGVAAGVVFLMPSKEPVCATADAGGAHKSLTKSYEDIVFVDLTPFVISLGPNASSEYLRVSISLETTEDHLKAAEHLQPRFRDVLNTYLRAVDERDLAEPAAMIRLRAQMLRRLQVAASPEIVSDVLITDFVLK